ncbi:MAG: hypothetical protein IPL36_10835 [Nigerium sp.]|nr:hypothetical protein [Nigerium sp.]
MNAPHPPATSIGRVDLLLGHATMLTADRWDDVAGMIQEAMGIALLLAATHPASPPARVTDLAGLGVRACIEQAWAEVQRWDLALAADFPDMARLRVLLTDLRHRLAAAVEGQG